jgi:hypothetical protein
MFAPSFAPVSSPLLVGVFEALPEPEWPPSIVDTAEHVLMAAREQTALVPERSWSSLVPQRKVTFDA